MDAPTAEEIVAASQLNFAEQGYDDAQVGVIVSSANSLLTAITGLTFDPRGNIDSNIEALVRMAVRGFSEQIAYQGTPEYLETLADFDLIQNFSAGPYSEARRNAGDAMKARMLNAWPWLNGLLWSILTDDKRDYWNSVFSGLNAPAFAVTEVAWGDTGFPDGGF